MYCTDVTHVVDLWARLIPLDMQHLLHGCANFWLSHWLVSTIFHCSSPPLRFFSTLHFRGQTVGHFDQDGTQFVGSSVRQLQAMLLFLLQGGPSPTSWAGKPIGKPIGPKEKVILGLYEGKMFQLWPCIWSHFANWLPIPPLKLWEKNVAVLSRGWLPQRWQLWFLSLLLPTGCERLQLGWWEPLAGSQGHMQIACHMLFLAKVQDLGKMKFIWLMFFI